MIERLLLLGDPRLYDASIPLEEHEVPSFRGLFEDLHSAILEFRSVYGRGRAIAAPQLGVARRVVCWNVGVQVTMINPVLKHFSEEVFECWDDCMSFPGLLVKVRRHLSCTLQFRDAAWAEHQWVLAGSESELIQHEVDHLDGILATQRALDDRSYRLEPWIRLSPGNPTGR